MENNNKAVFLDRDGTLIEDNGYLDNHKDLKVLPGTKEAIRLLNEHGFKIVIVSNQAGVARGLYGEDMVQTTIKLLNKEILAGGGIIEGSYYCPHHPEHGVYPYQKDCDCRKPKPGMIDKAAKEHAIDLKNSFMVGDRQSDIEAGKSLGLKSVLVLTGAGKEEKNNLISKPDFIADNILKAAEWILSQNGSHSRI